MGTFFPHAVSSIFCLSLTHTRTVRFLTIMSWKDENWALNVTLLQEEIAQTTLSFTLHWSPVLPVRRCKSYKLGLHKKEELCFVDRVFFSLELKRRNMSARSGRSVDNHDLHLHSPLMASSRPELVMSSGQGTRWSWSRHMTKPVTSSRFCC